jgi:hypothetical protein
MAQHRSWVKKYSPLKKVRVQKKNRIFLFRAAARRVAEAHKWCKNRGVRKSVAELVAEMPKDLKGYPKTHRIIVRKAVTESAREKRG